jgi:hypothetical protein
MMCAPRPLYVAVAVIGLVLCALRPGLPVLFGKCRPKIVPIWHKPPACECVPSLVTTGCIPIPMRTTAGKWLQSIVTDRSH